MPGNRNRLAHAYTQVPTLLQEVAAVSRLTVVVTNRLVVAPDAVDTGRLGFSVYII